MDCKPPFVYHPLIAFLLISGLLLSLYANSFNASWHMDDKPNIVNNQALHISDLAPQTLWKTFFANPLKAHKLYRPLPCLSFAINCYVGGNNTFGFHLVNFSFHLATAMALYFLFVRLLLVLNYQKPDQEIPDIRSVALLGAALWAINPIQTQAVTYIVQRMAIMAAFFYVLAMLYFVKVRTAQTSRLRRKYSVCCVFFFLCALGSKENAIILPFSLILVEWIFFQKGKTNFMSKPVTWIAVCGSFATALILAFVLKNGLSLEFIHNWYDHRPFTLMERLLTQPRVVLGYLSQIFYPLPERFSIAHDVTVFTSLLHPWTTLPAIGIIFSMIVGAFVFAPRYPLTAFAVFFFFLNHVVESSILPIELVFEHRNYLPSLFLFLPIAVGLQQLLIRLKQNNGFICGVLAAAIIIMIVGVGLSTYMRNAAWASEIKLWTDAAKKAPASIRPLVTLGIQLGWEENPSPSDYRHALALFRQALELPQAARNTEKAEILGNMGGIYFQQGKFEKAITTYYKALELDSIFLKNRSDLINPLIATGRFAEAEHHARYLISKCPDNPQYLDILGFILLWQDKPNDAIGCFQSALKKGLESGSLFANIGVTLTRLESWENSQWFLQRAAQKSHRDIFPLLALIENRSRANDPEGAVFYARQVISNFPIASIIDQLHYLKNDYRNAPLSAERIAPILHKTHQHALSKIQMKANP